MSYYQLPSGAYHARLMIDGVRCTATLPTRRRRRSLALRRGVGPIRGR